MFLANVNPGRFNRFHKCGHLIACTKATGQWCSRTHSRTPLAISPPLLDGHVILAANMPWEEQATLFNPPTSRLPDFQTVPTECAAMLAILLARDYW
ncbi:MAG: hypothetical protein ND895_14335 [Pyrinomonadaceae bacterium]|nr:hypothetical protein [Pyrinomonadaceae bacterium]